VNPLIPEAGGSALRDRVSTELGSSRALLGDKLLQNSAGGSTKISQQD